MAFSHINNLHVGHVVLLAAFLLSYAALAGALIARLLKRAIEESRASQARAALSKEV